MTIPHTTEKRALTKGYVVELATEQSRHAQGVTRAMRAHGWRHHYRGAGVRLDSTPEYRREEAAEALHHARAVELNARAVRSWVEAWARAEGVTE